MVDEKLRSDVLAFVRSLPFPVEHPRETAEVLAVRSDIRNRMYDSKTQMILLSFAETGARLGLKSALETKKKCEDRIKQILFT